MEKTFQSYGKKGCFITVRQGIGIVVLITILFIGACVLTASIVHMSLSSKDDNVPTPKTEKVSYSKKPTNVDSAVTTVPPPPTTTAVKGPSSCAEVKRCNPRATEGEYWLYPIMYGGKKKVKIFCHNMTAPDYAAEYLTLPIDTNYIIKHDLTHVVNKRECTRNSKVLYKVNYSRVRLLINAMVVVKHDYRFTKMGPGTYASQICLGYGEAADCSGHRWTKYCQRHGSFSVDLRNTGLRVDSSTRWMVTGYHAAIYNYTRSADLTQIYCLVGGWCGKCVPEDVIRLAISDEKLDDGLALTVVCN